MLFNSIEYVILLAITLVAYWAIPSRSIRQWIVLLSSIYFYMSWSYAFGLMLLAIIAVNWFIGGIIDRTRSKRWMVFSCVMNLGLLAYFKYMNFFLENLEAAAHVVDPGFQSITFSVVLPLGISFYVFELISYQVDVYKGKFEHEKNPVVFAIFVLFFPHLIAGPICRAAQFIPQVREKQSFNAAHFYNGVYMFVAGLALKSGLADGLAPFVNVIFNEPAAYSGVDNTLAVVGFGVQILGDFWGYSLMALGAAILFGYVLPDNFNHPYSALSIRDFWRRWHITLSNWLRDYLYIALGGSRTASGFKVQRNLALTMLLGGLWHGASWNFIIWGGIHGGALAINRWFDTAPLPGWLKAGFRFKPAAWLLTMVVVFVAWIFFRAGTLPEAITMIQQIITPAQGWLDSKIAPVFFELLAWFLVLQTVIHRTTYQYDVASQPIWRAAALFALVALFTLVYYVDGNDFIYFQF